MDNLEDINLLARPVNVPDFGLMCDLLWADPAKEWQKQHPETGLDMKIEGNPLVNNVYRSVGFFYVNKFSVGPARRNDLVRTRRLLDHLSDPFVLVAPLSKTNPRRI